MRTVIHLAPIYAIFDTFAGEEGRQAHLTGEIAKSVVRPIRGAGNTAGVTKGLRLLIQAKPEKVDAVRDFLKNAVPLIEAEPATPYWYAVEFPGTNMFGIVDFFPDDAGRNAHVAGTVAAALFGSAEELLIGAPDLVKLDIIAAKIGLRRKTVTISLRQWIPSVFMKPGLVLLLKAIRNADGGVSRAMLYLMENHRTSKSSAHVGSRLLYGFPHEND
ncbi:hypothetical protein BT96DRAFT_1088430 [Gymnopus androsaceus JB14]|uniref:ABM domain-containing protein n=1 Tax=Gymnopus androsaceus JB14 TaxID=1447944 RepID=A0A6A4HZD1_9AGAR|nr:hypothetical protein BT96DRAFT_1088430 [Gymnopus androsaceus JB14]